MRLRKKVGYKKLFIKELNDVSPCFFLWSVQVLELLIILAESGE
jgi:hypothetical protein